MTNLLLTTERDGRRQPITFQANKTGFYFGFDRSTGKFMEAKRFARNINIRRRKSAPSISILPRSLPSEWHRAARLARP
jgi:glucose dehydrogenase